MVTTGLIVIEIPTPLLAATAAVLSIGTALFWLFWLMFRRRSQKPAPAPPVMAWELIDGTPGDRKDLYISETSLELAGPDYRFIGAMPANFVCQQCSAPEDISLKLYHHLPSNSMIVITRHKCQRLLSDVPTVLMPAVGGSHAKKI